MNILIVCYYFPPAGLGGVQRPVKFAKYLARFGHQVTVITTPPTPGEVADDSLLLDLPEEVRIIRVSSPSPRRAIRSLRTNRWGQAASGKPRGWLVRQLVAWSRLPDDKIGFVGKALQAAKRAFGTAPPDVVLTTSPPPSVHLVGRRLRKMWRTTWVADFRDPWFMSSQERLPTPVHRALHRHLLRSILQRADRVVVVSPGIIDDFRKWGISRDGIAVIPNGYDEDDFAGYDATLSQIQNERFRFHLYGTISPNTSPEPFFWAVSDFLRQQAEMKDRIEISHRGAVRGLDLDILLRRYDLPERFVSLGYAPHWYAVKELAEAHCLVISIADHPGLRSNIPGRIYECLRSRRPILVFAPRGNSAVQLMTQFDNVRVCTPDNTDRADLIIGEMLLKFEKQQSGIIATREGIDQYSRETLTKRLLTTIDE